MPFLCHHGTCLECDSYTQHYGLAVALNEDSVMSSMSQLANLAAGLIQCMLYNDFHHQIQSYERKLDEAWEANDDLQAEIKDLCKKLGEAPHSSIPSVPVPSDKQFACDFKHAQIASLSGIPHHDQPGIGTSSSTWDISPPNTFSLRGRVQVKQPADHKGKQRQPLPPQVEPACPPMEDKITPRNLYADVPMTVDEPIVKETMFPNFNGTEYPYRVLHLGQGNDSIRLVLFMRINNNLYAYDNEMISKAVQWERDMMGPIILYNTAEEICKLYTMAYNEPEDKAPCICKVQGLVTYTNLWKRCRLEMNEVMDLTLKEWRPPIWASQKACQKREALRDKERIVDAPPIPSAPAAEELRPIMPLTHHVVAQPSGPPCRALLEWAEVAPAIGTPVPWEGGFTHLATMANVTTYLVANGITYHNADDALKWAWRAGNEYIAQIISNGGDKDPNTKVIIDQMRATLNKLLPMGKHHSLEWIDLQAHVLGVPPKSNVPYEVHPIEERDLYVVREFANSVVLYDLPHHARGEGSDAGGGNGG
ncbi:hypothetical protein EDC04DRAFT_2612463 [Pisolithus marmoratus]|nr:hypothetical protein EDC04DRAFT_2612463 [Pisolithus marmoratus]